MSFAENKPFEQIEAQDLYLEFHGIAFFFSDSFSFFRPGKSCLWNSLLLETSHSDFIVDPAFFNPTYSRRYQSLETNNQ